jgi:replicative DNA helicase
LQAAGQGLADRHTYPTGFGILDRSIGGGLRTRNLTLVGGAPGVGKTIATLQWARNLAVAGIPAVFACYEHDEGTLLSRLLHLELGEMPPQERMGDDGRAARRILGEVDSGTRTLAEAAEDLPILAELERRVGEYAGRLWLVQASGKDTTVEQLAKLVGPETGVLFVDYLQKVPVAAEFVEERERVITVSQGLKELAMEANVAVVAVTAADLGGMQASRLRLHHLRGSSSVAYEADVVILLNDKFRIVSKSQMSFSPTSVEGFRRQVVFTIEKNRNGPDGIDLEFGKQYEYLRMDPSGAYVTDRLIDDRLITE